MRRKAFLIAGGVAVVVLVALILMLTARTGSEKGRLLRTARVERRSIVIKVTESGEVAPLTVVNVKSELAGEVRRLFVEEGDSVKAGDRLALVQQESSQAQQIAQARASVERAKIDLEDTERDLGRKRELYDRGFIAKKDVEDAEQAHRRSRIQVELSEKQLWVVLGGGDEPVESGGLGAKDFDTITVTAPISGVVISMNVEQGEMITSGTQAYGGGGTILMVIADLSKMIVKTNVNEVDVGRIRVGQSAQIGFDAIRGRVYSGVVKKIAPAGTIDGNIVVFPIEVEIVGSTSQSAGDRRGGADPGGIALIRPGMTADLDIIIAKAQDVLSVPKEAVVDRDGSAGVMLLEEGKPVPRAVVTGLEDDVRVEVREGLKEGDEVIITDGQPAARGRSASPPRGGPPM